MVQAESPGVKPEDVDITPQNGALTIGSEHRAKQEQEREGGYNIRERRYGSSRRSIPLAEEVNEEKIHARFQNGVLEVRVEGAAAL